MKSMQTKIEQNKKSRSYRTVIILLGVLVALLIGLSFSASAAMPDAMEDFSIATTWRLPLDKIDLGLLGDLLKL